MSNLVERPETMAFINEAFRNVDVVLCADNILDIADALATHTRKAIAAIPSAGDDGWQPIETAPFRQDILVCMTQNLPDDDGWETIQWVDSRSELPEYDWFVYQSRIDIPFPPTHWRPLPAPPAPPSKGGE